MKITIPKSEDTVLKSVSILNHFEINKYRVIFLVISLTLLYLIFFEKSVIKRIEIYFVIYALAFGMLLIACTQSRYYSWDEQIHFKTVYSLANGKNVEWTDAALDIANRTVPSCNTKAEFAELRNLMDEKGQDLFSVSSPFRKSDKHLPMSDSSPSYFALLSARHSSSSVSYTHLDVYKRQIIGCAVIVLIIYADRVCKMCGLAYTKLCSLLVHHIDK